MTDEKLEPVSKEEDWEDAKYTFFVIVGAFAFGSVCWDCGVLVYSAYSVFVEVGRCRCLTK